MKYELNGSELKVVAEAGDEWTGSTLAIARDTSNGIPVLRCGEVKRGKKYVALCVRTDTRPELVALIQQWEVAKADELAERKRIEARTIRVHLSTRGWGDYSSLEWVGDRDLPTAQIVEECRRLLANGHDVDQPNQSADEVAAKIEAEKSKSLARDAAKVVAAERATEQAARIETKRAEIIASGKRLATPKQLAVIADAREDWFDIFDGCGSFGMHGPTDEELETLTIEEASALVGEIIDARKAGV